MCKELDRRTEQDIRNGVVPLWHDESQLNRYAAEHTGSYRLLPPTYWYPEGWQMQFEQKIIVRNKSRYFDVAAVKHHSQHTRSWLQCKWEAYCENYLPYLLCARDELLQKHL